MKYACINLGYYFVKGDFNKSFKSAYREVDLVDYGSNCDSLVLDGKTYSIGVGNPTIAKDKTENISNKLFVLNMLCKHMDDTSSEHFKVALTAPPMTFAQQKEVLPNYLTGSYKVIYNGYPKEIFIDSVTVYPETIMAYLANNPARFSKPVIVIDIGGLTTNIAYINNGSYSKETISSFTNGMYHIENAVCDYLNDKYWDLDLDATLIYQFLEKGIYLNGTTENIIETQRNGINKIIDEFLDKVYRKIELKKWSPSMCDILVTGGGGKLLFDNIKKKYPHAQISKDPIFDNFNGVKCLVTREKVIAKCATTRG